MEVILSLESLEAEKRQNRQTISTIISDRRIKMNVIQSLDVLEKKIMAGKAKGLAGALQIGQALDQIKENNLWLNSGCKTFEQYVAETHGFSRSSVYNFISISRYFGPLLLADPSLQTVDPTRLIRLLPFITEENKEELLHSAVTVPDAKSFENNLRNLAGKTATDDPHDCVWEPIPYEVCTICKQRRPIKDNI